MLAFPLYKQLIGWQFVTPALKADCIRAVHICYSEMPWKAAPAALCEIFLACSRYKLSAVKGACGSSMHTRTASTAGRYRLTTVLTCKRWCYTVLILVISSHVIVTGFGEAEGEAREKLGASKCGRKHQGLVGFALMIRDVALSIGKTRRDSE